MLFHQIRAFSFTILTVIGLILTGGCAKDNGGLEPAELAFLLPRYGCRTYVTSMHFQQGGGTNAPYYAYECSAALDGDGKFKFNCVGDGGRPFPTPVAPIPELVYANIGSFVSEGTVFGRRNYEVPSAVRDAQGRILTIGSGTSNNIVFNSWDAAGRPASGVYRSTSQLHVICKPSGCIHAGGQSSVQDITMVYDEANKVVSWRASDGSTRHFYSWDSITLHIDARRIGSVDSTREICASYF